tara:strand:+ start:225 stop:665 length:441 start_codon:yes stop_codon:yes gene_type:complete
MNKLITLFAILVSFNASSLEIYAEFCQTSDAKKAINAISQGIYLSENQELAEDIFTECAALRHAGKSSSEVNQERIDTYLAMSKFDRVFAWDKEQQERADEIPSRLDLAMVEVVFGEDSIEYSMVEARFNHGKSFGEDFNIITYSE